jgi:hypothetical protein
VARHAQVFNGGMHWGQIGRRCCITGVRVSIPVPPAGIFAGSLASPIGVSLYTIAIESFAVKPPC